MKDEGWGGRLSKWRRVVQGGVLAEFGKKRNTDDDFPPHWKCGSENKNCCCSSDQNLRDICFVPLDFPKHTALSMFPLAVLCVFSLREVFEIPRIKVGKKKLLTIKINSSSNVGSISKQTRRPLSTGIFFSLFAFITWAIAILGGGIGSKE